jgi:hypothetical protein
MNRVVWLGLIVCLVLPAFGQRLPPGVRAGGKSYGFGFGSVVFPGGPPTHPRLGFSVTDPGFASRLGGIVTGFRPYTGAPSGVSVYRRPTSMAVPVPYPVFVGGYYAAYPPPQQTPNVIVVAPPQQPAPQVVINQTFAARPEVQEYSTVSAEDSGVRVYQAPAPAPLDSSGPVQSQEPTIYLIAFKDGSVRTAIAYWVEDDTLHYVTPQGRPNKASMVLIDRDFSLKLNHQRGLEFHFPAGK